MSNARNEVWQYFNFEISYVQLNPSQVYLMKFSDIEPLTYDFAAIKSISVYCPNITLTNSTVVN